MTPAVLATDKREKTKGIDLSWTGACSCLLGLGLFQYGLLGFFTGTTPLDGPSGLSPLPWSFPWGDLFSQPLVHSTPRISLSKPHCHPQVILSRARNVSRLVFFLLWATCVPLKTLRQCSHVFGKFAFHFGLTLGSFASIATWLLGKSSLLTLSIISNSTFPIIHDH